MDIDETVGLHLKTVREENGLSQRKLARETGVSNGTISLIEQGRLNPSVSLLKRVLDGIPISLSEFFAMEVSAKPQVFFKESDMVELSKGAISYRQIGRSLRNRKMQIIHERYAPGADTGAAMITHEGEEGGIIISGRLEVTVGDERRTLGPGDAYYFDSSIPHRFRNPSRDECELITSCTPPSF